MTRLRLAGLLGLLALVGNVNQLSAQNIGPTGYPMPGRPQLSPYLNLLRGGNTAANYYMGVIPEKLNRQNFSNIENNLLGLDARVNQVARPSGAIDPLYSATTLPPTGHKTWYGTPNNPIGQTASAVAATNLRSPTANTKAKAKTQP